ncbi:unnamed protein product [Polarella glacialis]|uniref:Poly [ADP-ribose] polymerase n=1 Tax=Polarella glacialis TaxID=89957 RepID=A0A813LZQ4_POLGL|nr:unnamed protein product [Polarella glacialis]
MPHPDEKFSPGERVLMWNPASNNVDLEGKVSQVLESPLSCGSDEMPIGSVGVASGVDCLQTLWIRPEHIGSMLRKIEDPSSTQSGLKGSDAEAKKEEKEEKKVGQSAEEEQAPQAGLMGMMSSFFGGLKMPTVVAPEDEHQTRSLKIPSSPLFEKGCRVDMWSKELNEWESGGLVIDVLPDGSIIVSVDGESTSRTVFPSLVSQVLRKASKVKLSPVKSAPSDQSAPSGVSMSFAQGEKLHVWSNTRNEWDTDGVVLSIFDTVYRSGTFEIPAGSVTVSVHGGAETHTIIPEMFGNLRKVCDQPEDSVDPENDPVVPEDDRSTGDGLTLSTSAAALPDPLAGAVQQVISDGSLQQANSSGSLQQANSAGSLPQQRVSSDGSLQQANSAGSLPQQRVSSDGSLQQANSAGSLPQHSLGPDTVDVDSSCPAVSVQSSGGYADTQPTKAPLLPSMLRVPSDTQPTTSFGSMPGSPGVSPRALGSLGSCATPITASLDEPTDYDRRQQRILVIGPGFGRDLNPVQGQMLEQAGFQVRWLLELPNPETPGCPVGQYLPVIKQAIDEFQPHLLACASKGGLYMSALFQTGLWGGSSLIINRHPSFVAFPKGANMVLAHGSNDEYYQIPRENLETLARTASENRCFLYYTANSGLLGRGYTREGDRHNMQSLTLWDTLPRLCDAALSPQCPELQMMRSWRRMLTEQRLEAEGWLGHTPGMGRRLWASAEQKGMDDQILFPVPEGSEEHQKIATIFKSQPAVPRAYGDMNPGAWEQISIYKIERVENGMQEDGSAEPYYKALQRGIENQGAPFVPGLHTRWVFHGSSAVESIVTNPISGFQPLMSGSRAAALWGPGTYFARDAKYVYDGGFCSTAVDGSKQILMCLLMNGFTCLGDPTHKGMLPQRQGRHRYNSSVDSVANPEIFVTQSPGAAYPAYVITFA